MRRAGQTATEYMLIISVIVIAVVAAAYIFMPAFQSGVQALSTDVSTILDTGKIGDLGVDRDGGGMGPGTVNTAGLTLACDDPRLAAMYAPPPCLP